MSLPAVTAKPLGALTFRRPNHLAAIFRRLSTRAHAGEIPSHLRCQICKSALDSPRALIAHCESSHDAAVARRSYEKKVSASHGRPEILEEKVDPNEKKEKHDN